jgi:hypothetical protein
VKWTIVVATSAVVVGVGLICFGLLELRNAMTGHGTQPLITEQSIEMLPSRDDIASEWLISSSSDVALDMNEFAEGSMVSCHKKIGSTHSERKEKYHVATFSVYIFSNIDSAKVFYNKEVNKLKSEGDYREVAIPGVFSVIFDLNSTQTGYSWGYEHNIAFSVFTYSNTVFGTEDELLSFTSLLKSKISERTARLETSEP